MISSRARRPSGRRARARSGLLATALLVAELLAITALAVTVVVAAVRRPSTEIRVEQVVVRDPSTLTVLAWGGDRSCFDTDDDAAESATEISVRASDRAKPGLCRSCDAIAIRVEVTVRLTAPVGDRRIVVPLGR